MTLFVTNLGSAPAGPGNFRFLFVDMAVCTASVPHVAVVGTDLTGNKGLVQDVVVVLEVVQDRLAEHHGSTA